MARRNKYNRNDVQGVYDRIQRFNKWKNRFVLSLIILACSAIMIAIIIVVLGSQAEEIVVKYQNLSGAPSDSKQQFALHNVIITYEDNGKLSIEIVQGNKGTNASLSGVGDSDPGTPDGDTEAGGSGGTIDDPSDDGEWTGNGFELNAMDIYKSYSFSSSGSASNIVINGVQLYNDMPWKDDGNWYKFSVNAASDYLEYNLGSPIKAGSSFHTDNNNSDSPINRNGIDCMGIAWMPIFCFIDTNADGSLASTYDGDVCDLFYGVVILENNGKTYYMPICSGGDNKGHTFPGGLAQTYIGNGTVADLNKGTVTINAGGSTDQALLEWNGSPMHGTEIDIEEFRKNWSTSTTYNGGGMSHHPALTIETNKAFAKKLSSYTIKGYIIHKN